MTSKLASFSYVKYRLLPFFYRYRFPEIMEKFMAEENVNESRIYRGKILSYLIYIKLPYW